MPVPTKILIVRFSSLGDLILTTPFIREARHLFKEAKLDLLTAKEFSPLFAQNPHLNQILTYDRKAKESLGPLAKQIRAENYDLVFDLHRSPRSTLLLALAFGPFSGKVKRVDKRSLKRNLLITFQLDLFPEVVSQRQACLKLLQPKVGKLRLADHTELFPSPEDFEAVKPIINDPKVSGKPLIAIGPSASFPLKCWPKESYLELCLALEKLGFGVVLLGGSFDLEPAWIAARSQAVDASGRLSFLGTSALLANCKLSVSNDSAVVHFSEAVKTAVVALFGPTAAQFGFGPFLGNSMLLALDLPCRPCSRNGIGKCTNKENLACLKGIKPEMVLELVLERVPAPSH
ncbi:MAG: hypothetical protein A2527_07280 [Candidatus Lambdaproteobacteria bacterium RIFOXYD2_FULL_50_16]|uniref:Uncharacterized protein n=1 Tax=Candidatus Lambdaproteobacteria bacterium RIFOXYD2_FULL_50_16 TaxID=1817772 RepID=A0A1F6GB19_9PROT|nr:MAG: hypothetical protein A2527_07280 [Candidatus Lambdaproteobacteria bacterium RIFOXYD2_FULL_50_16]